MTSTSTAVRPDEARAKPEFSPAWSARSLGYLAISILVTVIGIVAGSAFTAEGMLWYLAILHKPWFTPPAVAFPIAWTTLFALMAFSFWRILRVAPETPGRRVAIVAFLVQLLFNVGWTWCFFGNQDPASAAIEVVAFETSILWMISTFRPLDRISAVLMWPYVAWVAFASILNLTIVSINPVFQTLWNR